MPKDNSRAYIRGWPGILPGRPNMRNLDGYLRRKAGASAVWVPVWAWVWGSASAVAWAVALVMAHKNCTPPDNFQAYIRGWPHILPCQPKLHNSRFYLCRKVGVWA